MRVLPCCADRIDAFDVSVYEGGPQRCSALELNTGDAAIGEALYGVRFCPFCGKRFEIVTDPDG